MKLICDERDLTFDGDIVIEGIKYEPYKIKSTVVACKDASDASGFFFKGEPTRVKIEGYIRGDTVSAKRELMRLCVPNKKFALDDGTGYLLELYADSGLEMSSADHLKGKVQKFTLSAVAPSHLWKGTKRSQLFYSCAGVSTDKNAIKVTNVGDESVGMVLKVLAVTKLDSVLLKIGNQTISYEDSLVGGDLLFIDTRLGKKSVMLQKNGTEELISVMERVNPSSQFFELATGENRIDFNIVNGMTHITVIYTPVYLR